MPCRQLADDHTDRLSSNALLLLLLSLLLFTGFTHIFIGCVERLCKKSFSIRVDIERECDEAFSQRIVHYTVSVYQLESSSNLLQVYICTQYGQNVTFSVSSWILDSEFPRTLGYLGHQCEVITGESLLI